MGTNFKEKELENKGQWNACDIKVEDDTSWREEGYQQMRVEIRG